jgi:CBS domain-containing protein
VIATARGLTGAIGELLGPRVQQQPVRVRDLMSRELVTCREHDDLSRAAQLMWDADCGAVPIVDGEGKLVGMLTDRDICMAAYTRGLPLSELRASAAMSTAVIACRPNDTLRSAMELMTTHKIRRLPVVDEESRPIGIVSLADLARLAQAPSTQSQEARSWVPGVLAGISEPPGDRGGPAAPS